MIYETFQYWARLRPSALALATRNAQWTYAQALRTVDAIAARLHAQGIRAGDRVALPASDEGSLFCLFALDKLGACNCAVYRGESWIKRFITHTASSDPKSIHVPLPSHADDGRFTEPAGELSAHRWSGGEASALKLSSGSTGKAKWIMRGHASTLANLAANAASMHYGPGAVCAHALGASSPAFAMKTNAWTTGSAIACVAQDPKSLLADLEALHVNRLAISPANLRQAMRAAGEFRAHPELAVTLYGGHAPAGLVERIQARLTQHVVLTYGTTETGVCTTAFLHERPVPDHTYGFTVPVAQAEVIGPGGTPVAQDERGRVRIRVHRPDTDGYLDDAGRLVPFQAADPAWFVTGDTGSVDAEGALHIYGREDDVVNLAGHKLHTSDIESAAQRSGLTVEEAALNVPVPGGRTQVFLAAVLTPDATTADLRRALRQTIAQAGPVRIATVGGLPRLANGKVDRQTLRKLILQELAASKPG